MTNLIIALILGATLVVVPASLARDANRDSSHKVWHKQQIRREKRSAVMRKTGQEKREALRDYIYDSPVLWDPAAN